MLFKQQPIFSFVEHTNIINKSLHGKASYAIQTLWQNEVQANDEQYSDMLKKNVS